MTINLSIAVWPHPHLSTCLSHHRHVSILYWKLIFNLIKQNAHRIEPKCFTGNKFDIIDHEFYLVQTFIGRDTQSPWTLSMFYMDLHAYYTKKTLELRTNWCLHVCNTLAWSQLQGLKFSEFSLISEFFPTFRAILEISVNLKRNLFMGVGVWTNLYMCETFIQLNLKSQRRRALFRVFDKNPF